MALPEIVSREQWFAARLRFLQQEADLTRRRDALNAERRRLPMVKVEKDYVFEGPAGPVTLAELFGDRMQLIIWHLLVGQDRGAACPAGPSVMDDLSPAVLSRLRDCETAFALVSRSPLTRIEAYRNSHGWRPPWYSSHASDFNDDFAPGANCFLRDSGEIFHTYSAYARGLDHTDMLCALLDLTALGRQQACEESRNRPPVHAMFQIGNIRAAMPALGASLSVVSWATST